MLTKEELEAMERLTHNWYDEYRENIDSTLRGPRMDARRVVDAIRREYLPGDELPFTIEWLVEVSIGTCLEPMVADFFDSEPLQLYYTNAKRRERVAVPPNSTRSQIRQFLAWQGIALRAP